MSLNIVAVTIPGTGCACNLLVLACLFVNPALAQTDQGMDMAPVDHSAMQKQMQGGKAPADARDPHAYSGGYTLTDGPYAMAGSGQLKLADEHRFKALLSDRLEYDTHSRNFGFDLQGWYGTTFDRLVVKTEGKITSGKLGESRTDLLWGHALDAFFDIQSGISIDQHADGVDRQWLAFGVQGLAPYWFELDLTAYLGEGGNTALRVEAEYELMLGQRLVLQPRTELMFYGRDDPANGLGSGLSDLALGLRLRYAFSRQFAPYVGLEWSGKFGDSATFLRAAGIGDSDTRIMAGLRMWF